MIHDSIKKVFRKTPFSWPVIAYRSIVKHEKQRAKMRPGSNDYIQAHRAKSWFEDGGDETLRLTYELNEESIVFDLGGYKGDFASSIMNKYDCIVYVFEPIPYLCQVIKNRFSNNRKLHLFCFGLYNKNTHQNISLQDNGSSIFGNELENMEIELRDIIQFMNEYSLQNVELIKINIEGAEYDLLEHLLRNNFIERFNNIQVQFHDFVVPNAYERMRRIQEQLGKTHSLTYQYEFVWENWKRQD